jgi:hypothetical protein
MSKFVYFDRSTDGLLFLCFLYVHISCRSTVSLAIGRFSNELLQALPQVADAETSDTERAVPDTSPGRHRLTVFSGHDTTIIPLLSVLGGLDASAWPPYAALLVMEVYTPVTGDDYAPDEPHVRILMERKPIVLSGCGGQYCPLSIIRSKLIDSVPTRPGMSWAGACRSAHLDMQDEASGDADGGDVMIHGKPPLS